MRKLLVLLTVVLAALAVSPGPAQAQPQVLGIHGTFSLRNEAEEKKCLDLEDEGRGRYVQQYSCHGRENQKWHFVRDPVHTDLYEIKPLQYLSSNECLDVEHNGTGVHTQRYPCHLGAKQRWRAVRLGTGFYSFRPLFDETKCLDASNWGKGVRAQIYPCHALTNQVWKLV
ncbi:RICIN domain-containing protein [Lentzea sp. JNUCC 0626]|uniref:RICIN domain-containing protein n=1 Tax=Lentzea sp. JNUCC 0626 TaxID=3367513 RepID=UPI00374832A2